MRTLVMPLMGLLFASSSWAEEGQSDASPGQGLMPGRSRIGIVVVETAKGVTNTDDFVELLVADIGKESGGGAEIVGPEELRLAIAPKAENRKRENAAVQKCIATPGCVSQTIVDKDLSLLCVGFLGKTVRNELRVLLTFYDSSGREAARDDFKFGKVGEQPSSGTFPSVKAAIASITVAFQFKLEPGSEIFLNDKQVRAERVAFLKPDTYQVRVIRPECRPWEQTFQAKAGETNTVASPPCDPWVPVKAGELRDQCLHYTRLVPPNWQAARPKCEEALAAGGKEDSKLLLTLARIAHEELELEKSFDYAERATQVTKRPSAEEDIRAAERFTEDVLRKRYGAVIVKLDESAKVKKGYIHLRDKGGLINPDKKRVFGVVQARLSAKEIALDREGTMFYLPFGVYKANAVPFTVEAGKVPEVEVILESQSPALAGRETPREKAGVPFSVWAVGGVGVAALATGAVLHAGAFGKADEYMAAGTEPVATQAKRDGERFQTLATAFYGLAAASVVIDAVILYAWWATPKAAEEVIRITPTPGGVTATVRF